MSNQDLIDQLKKAAGMEQFAIGFRMTLEKAANIIAANENPKKTTHWWDLPSELECRTVGLCKPLQNGVFFLARPEGNVLVHDSATSMGFIITREEFMDGLYRTVIPERWKDLMRRRSGDGLGAPDTPAT